VRTEAPDDPVSSVAGRTKRGDDRLEVRPGEDRGERFDERAQVSTLVRRAEIADSLTPNSILAPSEVMTRISPSSEVT